MDPERRIKMMEFSGEYLQRHRLSKLTPGKIESVINWVETIVDERKFQPPFRLGRTDTTAVVDRNGLSVGWYGGRNANSRIKLFCALLNEFYTD